MTNKPPFNGERMKLESLIKVKTGKLDANHAVPDGKFPFFTCAREPLHIDEFAYDCECVLLAGNGDLNVKYFSGKFNAYQRTYIIESKDHSALSVPYLYHFMCHHVEQLRKGSLGAVINYIKVSDIKNTEIPLPSEQIQSKIVLILNKLSSLKSQLETQTQKLDQLVKSRFIEMFGDPVLNTKNWPHEEFRNNVELINGRAYKQSELLHKGKYKVLRVGNFFSNSSWYYSDLELEEKKYCDKGDLLYAWSASFGPRIWNETKTIFHYHIWKIEVKDHVYDKRFLCYLLKYAEQSFIRDVHGIGMFHLTKAAMEQTRFIVPPLSPQQEFADFVAQVDKSQFVVQQQIEKLQTLYDSLAQEYFG